MRVFVRGTGEGGRVEIEGRRQTNHGINTVGDRIMGGGRRILLGLPPTPPSEFQVLPAAQSCRKTSCSRDTGWAKSGEDSQALADPDGGRRLVKFHCRQLGVQTRHRADQEGWQGKGRARACGHGLWGRVGAFMLKEYHKRIHRHDLEGGGGRRDRSHGDK